MEKHGLLEWREEFSVGVPAVDFEHQEMILLINELYENLLNNADKYTIGDFLGEVYAKIASHFALEEKIMRDRRYDRYNEHKQDHERLLDEISEIIDDFDEGNLFNSDRLAERLDEWFLVHFRTKDADLHKYLNK